MAVRGKYRNYVADTVDDLDGLSTEDAEGASCVVLTTPRSLYLFIDGVWELQESGSSLPDATGNELKFLQLDGDGIPVWTALAGGGDMLTTNNLGDVASVSEARKNLGITVSFNATVDLAAYKVVTSTGVLANSATIAHISKIIGINNAAVLNGFVGQATGQGVITNAAWTWTVGDKIYLNGTDLSTTAPASGFSQFIGTAVAADKISVNLGTPLLL